MPRTGEQTGVEIKVSFDDEQVARALMVLGLDDKGEQGETGEPRRVGFLEDTTVGVALPLFHHGIVLRVRHIEADDDDATVKLRPCRRSQLTGDWLDAKEGDGWKLTVEEDWAGSRRALAASCGSKLPKDRILSVQGESERVHRLFSQDQERFLSDCAGMPVNLDALTFLPLVAATRWKKVRVGTVSDVIAERWIIDDLDFLELSIRSDTVANAPPAQQELEREIQDLNLQPDNNPKSKTERVLTHLAGLKAAAI
jgi:hypothetical protein